MERTERVSKKKIHGLFNFFLNAVPALYAFTCIFPVVWLFYTTFKTQQEFSIDVLALPESWTNLSNYSYVLTQMPVLRAMFNTLRITAIVIFCVLMFSFINGYFLARFKFKGSRGLSILYMSNLLVPIHAILVPVYIIFVKLGLSNHYGTHNLHFSGTQLCGYNTQGAGGSCKHRWKQFYENTTINYTAAY